MSHAHGRPIVDCVTSVEELREQVARAYDALGMPSWPDPHPWHGSPRDEEYSRLTDPGRYRVVHARARAWAQVLADLPGVEVATLAPGALESAGRRGEYDRGVRIASGRPGTLPLLLLERDLPVPEQDSTLAVLHISLVEPEVMLAGLPDCGCDACDDGSARLLDEVDDTISQVVGGPFVVLQGDRWHAQWSPTETSAGGERQLLGFEQAQDLCRRLAAGEDVRLPRRVTAYVGRSWLHPS